MTEREKFAEKYSHRTGIPVESVKFDSYGTPYVDTPYSTSVIPNTMVQSAYCGWKAAKAQVVPKWGPVSEPPNDSRDVLCVKQSGTRVIDYYRNGRFQLSGDYVMWQELPSASVKDGE